MPTNNIAVNLGYEAALAYITLPLMGIAALVPGGAVAVATIALGLAVAPIINGIVKITTWRVTAGLNISQFDIPVTFDFNNSEQHLTPSLPTLSPDLKLKPQIKDLVANPISDGVVTLTITAIGVGAGNASKVFFEIGNQEIQAQINPSQIAYNAGDDTTTYTDVQVPEGVLLGAAGIVVRAQVGDVNFDNPSTSPVATIANKGGYAFTGDVRGEKLDVLGPTVDPNTGEVTDPDQQSVIKAIDLDGHPNAIAVTDDLSRVFVATDFGIDLIDGFTMTYYGRIDVGGDENVTALAISSDGTRLYAAVTGRVLEYDINPGDYTFPYDADKPLAYTKTPIDLGKLPNPAGLITALALNSDGTRLFVGVPGSRLFGGDGDPTFLPEQANSALPVQGVVLIVNVDPKDIPADPKTNPFKYNKVIGQVDGGLDIYTIINTSDPTKMAFTTRGDLSAGFHTITITQNDPNDFVAAINVNVTGTGNTSGQKISLILNNSPIGTNYFGLRLSDGTQFGETPYAIGDQTVDLDIRNATGVAVLPDMSYAFVADYDLPRIYYENAQLATDDENIHKIGSKIGVIKDPFTHPVLIASTTPIPLGFATDMVLSGDGTKLYVTYQGAATIVVFNVEDLIKEATNVKANLTQFAVDDPKNNPAPKLEINLPGIDVPKLVRGLAIQKIAAITLLSPVGTIDVDSSSPQPLDFIFKVDINSLGLTADLSKFSGVPTEDPYHADLFVSAELPGQGLWPTDPEHQRSNNFLNYGTGITALQQDPTLTSVTTDGNPNRVYTSTENNADGFLMGYKYTIDVNRHVTSSKFDLNLWNAHETEVDFDPQLSHILTAGQTYYWGVRLQEDEGARAAGSFQSAAVAPTGTYGTVTVLTHGFQFGTQILPTQENTDLQAPDAFMQMGALIAQADGGGVVLEYDKKNGQWVDINHKNADGSYVSGVKALKTGQSVVLVTDWVAESDISDSGFSEAAADAMFASLVDLNKQTDGALFQSAFHFIGHSRGTSVNSEIVQRMGVYFPDVKITLTSLDPHDNSQPSLDIPLAALANTVDNALKVAQAAAAATFLVGNPLAGVAAKAINVFDALLQEALVIVKALGIQVDPIQYGDFKDPDVQNWNNVKFADAYYQEAPTPESTSNQLAYVINGAAVAIGTIGDPAAAAKKAEDFFNTQKAQIEKDAKAALDQLGAAVKVDAQKALDDLTQNFQKDATKAFSDLETQINTDAKAAFNQLISTVQGDAKTALQNLSNTIVSNTQTALTSLLSQIGSTVQGAISQFVSDVMNGVLGQLADVTLDNVLAAVAQVGNITTTSLNATFDNLISQLQTLVTTAVNNLIQQNLQSLNSALNGFGAQVISDAKTAANNLGNTILTDVKNAFSGLITIEVTNTVAALNNFVALIESEAVTNLTSAAQNEFKKIKDIVVAKTITLPTFTATPNGRPVPTDDINESLDQLSGFGSEDFPTFGIAFQGVPIGVGGPHSRVWQWYAGTINTAIQSFGGADIYRRLSDTGLRATTFGIPLSGQEYSSTGWYFANPAVVTNNGNPQQQYIAASAGVPIGTSIIEEGVGVGFYFAPDGGGSAYDPHNPNPDQTNSKETDNTEAKLDGTTEPPVETVFNGNFQQGIKDSLFEHIANPTADWGRFPVSYQLPGWSFHGGSGFKLDASVTLPVLGKVGGTVDITGLFVLPTNAEDALKPLIDNYITSAVDNVVGYLETYYQKVAGKFKIPSIPDVSAGQAVLQQWHDFFDAGGQFDQQFADAANFVQKIQDLLNSVPSGANPLSFVELNGDKTLADIFSLNGGLFNPTAIDGFKKFLIDNAEAILKTFLPSASEGLLFGGASALLTVMKTAFNLSPGSSDPSYQTFVNGILTSVANKLDFSTLTHDRLYVPDADNYVNFNLFVPLALTPSTTVEVTVAVDDNGALDTSKTPLDQLPEGATAHHEIIKIDGAFFQDMAESVHIPAAMQGHMVLISFKEINRDSNFVGPDSGNIPFTGSNNPLDAFSSLFILENVSLGKTSTDNDFVAPPQPQVGDVGAVATGTPVGTLTLDEVTQAAAEARADWIASGLVPNAAALMDGVSLHVGLLSSGDIGAYANGSITIDASGDGVGWFTGLDNGEFAAGPNGTMVALTGTDAASHFDLLTVLEHEYGHALGLDDLTDGSVPGALMSTSLMTGMRIMPSAKDLTEIVTQAAPVAPVVTLNDMQGQLGNTPQGTATGSTMTATADAAPARRLAGER